MAVTGAKGAVTYQWSDGQTTETASNLVGGTYTVTVNDASGCSTTASITIAGKTAININEQVTDLACPNEAGGEIIANASGGTGNYTYNWSTAATGDRINNIQAGTYSLTVTDSEGCQATKNIDIAQPAVINVNPTITPAADCLLYTSPSPRDATLSRMPSSA